MQYDLIILLGTQPDLTTWKLPEQINACLYRAKQLLDDSVAPYIVTSGKWSITVDTLNLRQPFYECDEMARLLAELGVAPEKILTERSSKDSISNLYYLKKEILIPRNARRLLFVVADFRIPRLQFLCERILGDGFDVDFEPIKSEPGPSYNEPKTLQLQTDFLRPMKDGDHEWLADKFFDAPMYRQMAELDKAKYAKIT